MRIWILGGAGLVTTLIVSGALPTRGRACTCAGDVIASSEPRDGERDVHIDIAPLIEGYFFEPSSVVIEREDDGSSVEFELQSGKPVGPCARVHVELRLATLLEAETAYVIRAEWEGAEQEVRFTTGSGRVPERELRAPGLTAAFVDRSNLPPPSCGAYMRGCIAVDGEQRIEVVGTRGGEELFRVFTEGSATLAGIDRVGAPPDCVVARERDAAGRRSKATELCGEALPFRPARASDFDGYALRCKDGVIGDDSPELAAQPLDGGRTRRDASDRSSVPASGGGDGCSISARPGGQRGPLALLAGVWWLLFGRRRRVERVRPARNRT
jgi:hypothetical protein